MSSLRKQLRDRARYNAFADLADRYPGEYSVLYEGWSGHFFEQDLARHIARDRARHAAQRDLIENHLPEFNRLLRSWLKHFERRDEVKLPETGVWSGQTPTRGAGGRFIARPAT